MEKTPAPLSRKAPGDRRLSFDNTGRVAFFIRRICSERKGVDLPSFFLPPPYFMIGMTKSAPARIPVGQRDVIVFIQQRTLPAAEAVKRKRHRDRHVDPDHPRLHPSGEFACGIAVPGEDGVPVDEMTDVFRGCGFPFDTSSSWNRAKTVGCFSIIALIPGKEQGVAIFFRGILRIQ